MLTELADDKLIHCRCTGDDKPDYDFEVIGATARVFCRTCGASREFPMGSALCADEFLNMDEIELS